MENKVYDEKAALEMVDNDSELLSILLNSFLETEFDIKQLVKLINEKNYEEAASYTHRVKGAGRQIAAVKLASAGQKVEDVLRKKTTGDLKLLLTELNHSYTETVTEIKKHV
ncbi:MAG: Hpt domain-containing protein [Treponema sp.]|nr:Hpt domain-containing protein [Treponema sp.]